MDNTFDKLDRWMDGLMNGWNFGRMDGSTADAPTDRQKGDFVDMCAAYFDLIDILQLTSIIGISTVYFDLIDVFDVMTADKKMDGSLKTA